MNIFVKTALLTAFASPAFADQPVIEAVSAHASGLNWSFSVTLSHPDTGWDHYADGWKVLDSDGQELGYRTLAHPHVNEQPFTRSLSGVVIPESTASVFIQARDTLDGWGTQLFEVPLN